MLAHERTATSQFPVKGFTLLELLVVIAIIGLLASYVGPKLFGQLGKSETQVARAQIDGFRKALAAFRLDVGRFPTATEGLDALVQPPPSPDAAKWRGAYLDKAVPLDPWGRKYVYRAPGEQGREYEIVSLGKDGAAGGSLENADVTSWE